MDGGEAETDGERETGSEKEMREGKQRQTMETNGTGLRWPECVSKTVYSRGGVGGGGRGGQRIQREDKGEGQ